MKEVENKEKKDSMSIFDDRIWEAPITSSRPGRISMDGFRNSLETFSRSNSRKSSASSTFTANSVAPDTPNTEVSISAFPSIDADTHGSKRDSKLISSSNRDDEIRRDMNEFQFPSSSDNTYNHRNRNKRASERERELPKLRTSDLSSHTSSDRDSFSISPKSHSSNLNDGCVNPIEADMVLPENSFPSSKRHESDFKTQIDSAISITLTPLDEQGKSYKKPIYIKRPDEEPVSVPGILDDFWTLDTSTMISKMEKDLDRSKFNNINDLRDQLVNIGATQDEQRLIILITGSKKYTLRYSVDTSRTPSTWKSTPPLSVAAPLSGQKDLKELFEFEIPDSELLFDISDSVFKVATGYKVDEGMTNHQLASMINRSCFTEGGEINSRLKKIREKVELYDLASPYRDQEDHGFNAPFSHCDGTCTSNTIEFGAGIRGVTKTSNLLDNATYYPKLCSMKNHDHGHSHSIETQKKSKFESIIRRSKSFIKKRHKQRSEVEEEHDITLDSLLEELGATRALAKQGLDTALLMEDKVHHLECKRLESNLGTCRELKLVIDSLRTSDSRLF